MALNRRNHSRNPLRRMKAPSLPKSLKGFDLGKVDLDKLTDAAHSFRSFGEQVGEVADAADKTRKKHK
jgi:hypothetical protein